MSVKRFVIHPGLQVGAGQLMELYRVRPSECIVIDRARPETSLGLRKGYLNRLRHLRVASDYVPITDEERARYPRPSVKMVIHFDGGCRASKKLAAGGAVVYDVKGNELAARARFVPGRTTPEAEYTGLILGLETALELGATEVSVWGDAELIVRHVDGRYACRKEHLRVLLHKVWELGGQFERNTINEFPKAGPKNKRRHMNERADELANLAMDAQADIAIPRHAERR